MQWPWLLRYLIGLAWLGLPVAVFAGGESRLDLRDDYRLQQAGSMSRTAKLREERMAQCLQLATNFSRLDRFQSPTSRRVYGVDLRGRVWLQVQGLDGSCTLQRIARLERLDYLIEPDGTRLWQIFYYENKQLCLYSRLGQSGNTRRICYDPVDGVSRLAPYFLH